MGASRFFRISWSHIFENFRRVDRCVSETFWSGKKTMVKKVVSSFLVKNFLSHSAKTFVRGTLVFQKSSGSEIRTWIRGRV